MIPNMEFLNIHPKYQGHYFTIWIHGQKNTRKVLQCRHCKMSTRAERMWSKTDRHPEKYASLVQFGKD